jgi:hypothetical protein
LVKADGSKKPFSASKCAEAIFAKAKAAFHTHRPQQRGDQRPRTPFKGDPGTLVHVVGLPDGADVNAVRDAYRASGKNVRWVEILPVEADAVAAALVRFDNPADATAACAIVEVNGAPVTAQVATGEVDAGFWKRMSDSMDAKRARLNEPPPRKEIKVVAGCLLEVDGIPRSVNGRDVKESYSGSDLYNVRFVEMVVGPEGNDSDFHTALIRFNSPIDAAAALEVKEVSGTAVTAKIATGDAEKGFWSRMEEHINKKAQEDFRNGGGRGGGGGGFRRGGKGGKGKGKGGGGKGWRNSGKGGRGGGKGRRW